MTDYKIENTDINDEENFRAWERLVMDYEPVRRNLYEVYCKSLENGCKKATKPEPEPEPKKTFSDWRPVGFPNGPIVESDGENFSSDEEDFEEINDIDTTEELTQQLVDKNLKFSKAQDDRIQRNIDELNNGPYPNLNLSLQFFRLEIPKMKLNIKLYHKNSANKHVSFTTDSCEFSQNIVIQKEKKFWINLIDGNPNVKQIQLNKTQKDILLAAYPYDKKRLPTMIISHIKD